MTCCPVVSRALFMVFLASTVTQGQVGRRGDVLDVNTASEKQLLAVPGLTPALVKGVISARPFQVTTDLDALLGQSLSCEQRADAYLRLRARRASPSHSARLR